MTSFVSGDSVFVGEPVGDGPANGSPIAGSPFVVRGSVNINTAPLEGQGINLKILNVGPNGNNDAVYAGDETDIIRTGAGNDVVNAGGGDDFVVGGGANDIIRGGDGDDVIRGGSGADVLIGGEGADVFRIIGDPVDGAYGADSDLRFDSAGNVIVDAIVDFNDSEDLLVLQDLNVNGIGTVSYHEDTGNVTLTDSVDPDISRVIAKLPAGLDIVEIDQGDGNWTLM
ncbi:MAG: hypothetical protein AAGA80_22200 [Cyanobacteria bacterium P01_F01_bin.143]